MRKCGAKWRESGNVDPLGYGAPTTIWGWLVQLNAANFSGHSNWHIPTVGQDGGAAQLETILAAPFPNCASGPCVPAVFNTGCNSGYVGSDDKEYGVFSSWRPRAREGVAYQVRRSTDGSEWWLAFTYLRRLRQAPPRERASKVSR
jgi:hypothetical protein